MRNKPLITLRDIGRTFGPVVGLRNLNFELYAGEVVALLGDNGAGKSTLIKVLTGVYAPTSGTMSFKGQSVRLSSPQNARNLGIETVYQDLALVPALSIARNFFLGREKTRQVGPIKLLDNPAMARGATQALASIGIHIRNANEPVGSLSGGERQSIAIGRAVHFGLEVLILDEPTSALSIGETRKVLHYIQSAKERGLGVIFITHNIHHVFEVADRLTILNHGSKLGDFHASDVTQEQTAAMLMGEGIPPDVKPISAGQS